MAKKPPKFPTFNPDLDGSPFHWIIQTSARIREENTNGQREKTRQQPAKAGEKK
jgi:hypothetical protein